ncbi:MAG TPA: hypothetical protein VK815_06205 [Candidatus Acidoferrales bacterium]|jgi:hypothetical protein|nr:hypothetical protein [Candidatus Acidoferrales bacterium]
MATRRQVFLTAKNIIYKLAFSPKPVNERMAPATVRHIEFTGAPPDLIFGGVIFDFNHRRQVSAARWSCSFVDLIMFFHDLASFDLGKLA